MMKSVLLTSSAIVLFVSVTAVQAQSTQAPAQVSPAQTTTPSTARGTTVGTAPPAQRAAVAAPIVQGPPAAPERVNTSIPLTLQDRSKIGAVLASERSNAISVAFPLTAGTSVPQQVRLTRTPPEIGAVVRAFAGKSFFVTPDSIVIVNPRNRQIISAFSFPDGETPLVPAISRQAAALTLLPEQREMIRREVAPGSAASPTPLTRPRIAVAGDPVSGDVRLQEFPSTVSDQLPKMKNYRYYQIGHEVVIVDPSQKRVLDVIQ